MTPPPVPLITIITATYNRSNVLAFAIRSVLWQTFTDWELWVVGDACTDDTEQVVAAFQDARIHFINLPRNIGEQSGPNNEGVRRARGRYLAFLNHDDLWLPDHLELAVRGLTETGADLVFTLMDVVLPSGARRLSNQIFSRRYEPELMVPASSWLLRRELSEELGGWRFYRHCYSAPSQDFLFRAWKAGKQLRLVPHLTVVAIPSGQRQAAYARREQAIHEQFYQRILHEPDFRARELTEIVTTNETLWLKFYPAPTLLGRAVRKLGIQACTALGLNPSAVFLFFRYLRKGRWIDQLRKNRGLPPLK